MKRNSINVGSASLILIFMVMCLSCVSWLSLSITDKDRKSSDRMGEKIQVYYNADTEANRYLEKVYMTLDDVLKMDTIEKEAYLAEAFGDEWSKEEHTIETKINLSEYQDLSVKLRVDLSENESGVEVLEWNVCNKEVEINQDMNVIIFDE